MFRHLATCIAELAHVDTWLNKARGIVFAPGARATLDAALAEGKGVVLVAGHIGNWELMAQALAHAGYPLCTIAKPLYDPRLTRWVHRERVRHGMEVIWRGDALSARHMLQVFRRGHMLGILIDQDTTPRYGIRAVFWPSSSHAYGGGHLGLALWGANRGDLVTSRGRRGQNATSYRMLPLARNGDVHPTRRCRWATRSHLNLDRTYESLLGRCHSGSSKSVGVAAPAVAPATDCAVEWLFWFGTR